MNQQTVFITGVAGMTGAQIVAAFADDSSGTVIFDFGGGNTLTLENIATTAGLESDVFAF